MNTRDTLIIAVIILLLAGLGYAGYALLFKPNPEKSATEVARAYCDCAEKNNTHFKNTFRNLRRMFEAKLLSADRITQDLEKLEESIKGLTSDCNHKVSSQRTEIKENLGEQQLKLFDDTYKKRIASCSESVDKDCLDLLGRITTSKMLLAGSN